MMIVKRNLLAVLSGLAAILFGSPTRSAAAPQVPPPLPLASATLAPAQVDRKALAEATAAQLQDDHADAGEQPAVVEAAGVVANAGRDELVETAADAPQRSSDGFLLAARIAGIDSHNKPSARNRAKARSVAPAGRMVPKPAAKAPAEAKGGKAKSRAARFEPARIAGRVIPPAVALGPQTSGTVVAFPGIGSKPSGRLRKAA